MRDYCYGCWRGFILLICSLDVARKNVRRDHVMFAKTLYSHSHIQIKTGWTTTPLPPLIRPDPHPSHPIHPIHPIHPPPPSTIQKHPLLLRSLHGPTVRHPILGVELDPDLPFPHGLVVDGPAFDDGRVRHEVEFGVERGAAVCCGGFSWCGMRRGWDDGDRG